MKFFGYNNEQEAVDAHGEHIRTLPRIQKNKMVATSGKRCIGSFDGKTFLYDDGSSDLGESVTLTTIVVGDTKIQF